MASMWSACLFSFFVGLLLVSMSPSPYFGAIGLATMALAVAGFMVKIGSTMLALVFVIIYLSGMLVVFMFAAAASNDRDPQLLGPSPLHITVMVGISFFWFNILNLLYLQHFAGGVTKFLKNMESFYGKDPYRSELEALAYLYNSGSPLLFFVGMLLLLTLVSVLALIKGAGKGPNRPF